jgi:hypothetical protein
VSRAGYSDDGDCERYPVALWRTAVYRAIDGKRGQAFLREMADALDALPTKELIVGEIVSDSKQVCAIGAVALARNLDVSGLDVYDGDDVGGVFGIAQAMAREIAYENDERGRREETPAERWARMRKWCSDHIHATPPISKPEEP